MSELKMKFQLTFIPGVANLLSLGTLALGLQLWLGARPPLAARAPAALRNAAGTGQAAAGPSGGANRLAGDPDGSPQDAGATHPGLPGELDRVSGRPSGALPFANILPAIGLVLLRRACSRSGPSSAWLGAGFSLDDHHLLRPLRAAGDRSHRAALRALLP